MEAMPPANDTKLGVITLTATALGVLGIAIYAIDTVSWRAGMRLASLSVLLGGAFGLLGLLLGFLFGIPRTFSGEDGMTAPATLPAGVPAPQSREPVRYQVNTSLEQISDWLTKILVGVGLTQLQNIPGKIRQAAQGLSAGFPQGEKDASFIVALMLYAAASGFLLGYLWTRLFLAPRFREADLKLQEKEQKVQENIQTAQAERKAAQQELQSAQEEKQRTLEYVKELGATMSTMLHYLYQYEQEGFRRAIEAAQTFIGNWGEPTEAMFWIRLMAAYGQQLRWEKEKDLSPETQAQTKREALKAIDKALASDRAFAEYWLRYLGDPHFPGKPKEEDDLEVLWDDPDFQQRLTPRGASPSTMP